MLTPVICNTCGGSIGHVAPIFNVIKGVVEMDELEAIYKALNIINDCCKTNLITAVPLSEVY